MAGLSTAIAVAGLATSAGGTYVGIQNSKKAAKAQRQANQFQQKQADLAAARRRRDAIRATRLAFAESRNRAANQGVSSSSGAQGGQGSIISQGNANLSFLDQYKTLGDQAGEALGRARTFEQRAQTANAIAGFGMSLFNNSEKLEGMYNDIFKGK